MGQCVKIQFGLKITLCFIFFPVPSPPQMFVLVATGSTGLTASWEPPVPANGNITGYTVYCRTAENQLSSEQSPTFTPLSTTTGDVTADITGLTAFTNYECYATANTSIGEGTASNTKTVRTDQFGELYFLNYSYGILPRI